MWLRQAAGGAPQSTEISGVESAEDQGLLCQQKTGCLSASTIRKQQPHQVGGQLEDSIVTEGVKDPHVSRVGTKEWKSWLATQLRIMFLPFDHAASPWLAAFVRQTVSSSWHMVALLFTRFVGLVGAGRWWRAPLELFASCPKGEQPLPSPPAELLRLHAAADEMRARGELLFPGRIRCNFCHTVFFGSLTEWLD